MQVYVTASLPELHADLSGLPPRARAERLRTLAVLGLSMMHAYPHAATPMSRLTAHAAPVAECSDNARRDRQRRDALMRRLGVADD